MSIQAREAIIAEGISSPDELRRRAGSIAHLVNIGVPYPMARRVQANLRCEERRKASLGCHEQALPRAEQGFGARRDAGSPRGVAGGGIKHLESAQEGQGERGASGTHMCAGGQQQHAASTPHQGEVADLMAQFRVRPSEDGGGGAVWVQEGRGSSSRHVSEPVERRRHEWEGDYDQAARACAGLAPDLSEWLGRHARCRVQAVDAAGQGSPAAVRRGHEKEERGRDEDGWWCDDTGQDGVCAGHTADEGADAGAGPNQDFMYPGLVQARLTDFTSLWKSTECELVDCGLSQDVAAQLVVEVKKREQEQLDRLAEAAAAAGTKGLTRAASEISSALREGAKAIADGSDKARNNYEEEGMRGAGSKMLVAASQASAAAATGLAKSWQILARVAAADIDDLVSARALGLSFDHGLVSSSFEILSPDDSAPDSVIAKYSFRKPTQEPASGQVCTAVGFALRPGCALHVFDFVVRALSHSALLRLGLLQEIGCINLNVDGSFRTGDDGRSWALTSPGTLVHKGEVHGPRLGFELATGDVVRVIYHQSRSRLRFAYNGILVGRQFDGVCGPVVPCVTCSEDSKCVIQITGYWTA